MGVQPMRFRNRTGLLSLSGGEDTPLDRPRNLSHCQCAHTIFFKHTHIYIHCYTQTHTRMHAQSKISPTHKTVHVCDSYVVWEQARLQTHKHTCAFLFRHHAVLTYAYFCIITYMVPSPCGRSHGRSQNRHQPTGRTRTHDFLPFHHNLPK